MEICCSTTLQAAIFSQKEKRCYTGYSFIELLISQLELFKNSITLCITSIIKLDLQVKNNKYFCFTDRTVTVLTCKMCRHLDEMGVEDS